MQKARLLESSASTSVDESAVLTKEGAPSEANSPPPAPSPAPAEVVAGLPEPESARSPLKTLPAPSSYEQASSSTTLTLKAATEVQRVYRGARVRRRINQHLGRAVAEPDLKKSVAHAESLLPHDQNGELLPLNCPIECFQAFGSGIYTYMLWVQLMRKTFLVAFAFNIANMVHNITGGELKKEASVWSIHTLGNVSRLNTSYGATEVLVLGVLLYAMFEGVRLVRSQAALLQPYATPADLTIMVSGLPLDTVDSHRITRLCSEFGRVMHATVAPAVRELLLRMEGRQRLVEALQSARIALYMANRQEKTRRVSRLSSVKGASFRYPVGSSKRGELAPRERRGYLMGQVESAQQMLDAHDRESERVAEEARTAEAPSSGVAFVTFAEPEEARQAIAGLNDHTNPKLVLQGNRLTAERAPEPTDVLWENLQVSAAERWSRQLVALGITLAISLFGTAIIATICYVNSEQIVSAMVDLPSGLGGLLLGLLFNLVMTLPVIVGYVSLFITVPIMAARYERYATFASKELHVMLRLTFFQVFNLVVASAAFLIDPTVRENSGRKWFALGGALLANFMFGDCILIQVLLDFVKVDTVVNRNCLAPKATTQLEMDRLYTAEADIYLAFRLQLAGKFVVICAMFGSAIPILYLIAALYFWLAAWIDRYNLLRRIAPPPVTGPDLTQAAALGVVPLAVLLHVVMALVFFSILRAPAETSFGSGDFAGSGDTAPEVISAFEIQVFTAIAAAVCILFFFFREWARSRGIELRLCSEDTGRKVMRVITQVST